jgi:hypothetical protein
MRTVRRGPGRRATLLLVAVLGTLVPRIGPAQTPTPPGGTTPGGGIFDHLQRESTRPTPAVPAPPATTPQPPSPAAPPAPRTPAEDMVWVPGRTVHVPGVAGTVFVPGHWERRLSEHEVYVPPLTGHASGGGTVRWPAGVQPPAHERQSP